jgi:hypothetical protein
MAATFNLGVQGGVGVIQLASGLLVAAFALPDGTIPEAGYRAVFFALAGTGVLALLAYLPLPDAKPSAGGDR